MGALKGRDIVCFSGDWDGDPLPETHAMKILARDNRVLWVDASRHAPASGRDVKGTWKTLSSAMHGLQERGPNLWVLTPLSIPFSGSDLVRAANAAMLKAQIERALTRLAFRNPIHWSFSPGSARVAGTLGESLVVYHRAHESGAFSASGWEGTELERRLLLKADVVICASERLRAEKARVNPNAHLVRHGVDLEHFGKALDPQTPIPAELKGAPGPVIGLWGPIASWIDLELVRYVADAFSGGTVALLGDSVVDLGPLEGARNVLLPGRRPYADLPGYAKAFDVALVPFRVDEHTRAANPLEVREYLAAGLPVVSTAIPEIERLGVCIGNGPDEVVRQIAAAIAAGPGPNLARAAQVKSEGWEARAAEMQEIVLAALGQRKRAA